MSSDPLERAVKGAPRPDVSVPEVAAAAVGRVPSPERAAELHEAKKPNNANASDPLSLLPSSPPQIYLNLLILEASLRAQYLTLQARRRQHTFFLTLLALWIAYFFYALFHRPREDGKGRGGSPYWMVDMGEKVAFMGGILTAVLIWGTGQLERGIRWPRRWVAVTNRGLRGMNLKIVKIRGPWWKRTLSYIAVIFPYPSFSSSQGSSYQYMDVPQNTSSATSHGTYREEHRVHGKREEDVAPGGDHIKLLLLPKQFSPEFRENWELYRAEYWERENERRAELRKLLKAKQRHLAKEQGGWLWWTGWRGWSKAKGADSKHRDLEKLTHHHGHGAKQAKDGRRRMREDGSYSRSSSRSSATGTPEVEDGKPPSERGVRTRKHRSSTSTSTRSTRSPQRMTPLDADEQPAISKRASIISNASSSNSDGDVSERSSVSGRSKRAENLPNVRTRQRDLITDDRDND